MAKFTKLNIGDIVASSGGRVWKKLDISGCITFSSPSSFTLGTANSKKNWDGELEYSTDAIVWNTWDGATPLSADDGKLYLRGSGNTIITGKTAASGKWNLTGSNISCYGNIENLLDYQTVAKGEHPTMGDYCYRSMFIDCTSLITAPELLSTTLSRECYAFMFEGCTNLVEATSIIPADEISYMGCNSMFEGCTSLIKAPELPATILGYQAYYNMFNGCTSLITPPELPSTNVGKSSGMVYSGMFRGCTQLKTAPKLPSTELSQNCYSSMFEGCTSLTTVPELPATTLADSCYQMMFENCVSLTTLPRLPVTGVLPQWCYRRMFAGCTNIKLSTTQTEEYQNEYRIPTSGTASSYTSSRPSNLQTFDGTGGTFTGTPAFDTTYYTSNTVV